MTTLLIFLIRNNIVFRGIQIASLPSYDLVLIHTE